jgi:hypothetical protein
VSHKPDAEPIPHTKLREDKDYVYYHAEGIGPYRVRKAAALSPPTENEPYLRRKTREHTEAALWAAHAAIQRTRRTAPRSTLKRRLGQAIGTIIFLVSLFVLLASQGAFNDIRARYNQGQYHRQYYALLNRLFPNADRQAHVARIRNELIDALITSDNVRLKALRKEPQAYLSEAMYSLSKDAGIHEYFGDEYARLDLSDRVMRRVAPLVRERYFVLRPIDFRPVARHLAERSRWIPDEYRKFTSSIPLRNYGRPAILDGQDMLLFDLNDDGRDERIADCLSCPRYLESWTGQYWTTIAARAGTFRDEPETVGEDRTRGYRNLYSSMSDEGVQAIVKWTWNGSSYEEAARFTNPSETGKVATLVMAAIASSDPALAFWQLKRRFGIDTTFNGLVFATIGESEFPMPTDVDYERYLKVLSKETGSDFYSAYKDKDPAVLAEALYDRSVNPLFLADPRIAAAIVLGKGIAKASGNDGWSRHCDRMAAANIGGVRQFREYNGGRNPTPRELEMAMTRNVMSDNPRDRAPLGSQGKNAWNTTHRWHNPTTGQSGETRAYQSRDDALRSSVTQREAQIQRNQQENFARAQRDADAAVKGMQKSAQDLLDSLTRPQKKQ